MPFDPATGRFLRTQTDMERYLAKIDTSGGPDACHPWTGGTFVDSGYGRFSLGDARRSSVRSHRWGYTQLVGPIPDDLVVRHTCDMPLCHNPRHWVLGTNADNSADMVTRGRSLVGERNHASKLTEADVVVIKRDLLPLTANGKGRRGEMTIPQIAARFGVTPALISQIKAGRAWKHVIVE